MLRLLGASIKPTKGQVQIGDHTLTTLSSPEILAHRRRCGLIDQGLTLVPQLNVHSNVVAGRLTQWPWYKILASLLVDVEPETAYQMLRRVGLGDRQFDATVTLSGGQQQRVAIARALISRPAVILADEPTASLDPTTADEIIALLLSITRSADVTLVISSHSVERVAARVERLIGLREGRILFDKPSAQVGSRDLTALYAESVEQP
jgi:phosphonate transport system ATP-binding protein